MKNKLQAPSIVAAAAMSALMIPSLAIAQAAPSPSNTAGTAAGSSTNTANTTNTQAVVITGSQLGASEAAPISVLSGDELERRRGTSLGDTLNRLPGVSSTYFGPNANRPTIRGQDGERVRILANGGASADASTLSFDHAVPLDPLVIERLEVLRGPAALRYGGSAIGGVVNIIDNRIPGTAPDGFHAASSLRLGGAAQERGVSGLLEGGGQGVAWHVDAFTRRQDDLRVPGFDVFNEATGELERRTRLLNSSSSSQGGAAGVSRVWQGGHAGLSVDTFRSEYGSIAEEAIRIRMRRERIALKAQTSLNAGMFAGVEAQASSTRYAHDEIEEGAVGTQFRNRGHDVRLEAQHRPWSFAGGSLSGTWGLQLDRSNFSALGEEAFVPPTKTSQTALFAVESWEPVKGTVVHLGLRGERVQVDSSGDAADSGTAVVEPRFGPAVQRRFSPRSASLGAQHQLSAAWQGLANVSSTQRAPAAHELYANGVHAATGAFELGDVNQALESARHLEVGVQGRLDAGRVKLNAFTTRYANYIALSPTGDNFVEVDVEGASSSFPIYAYRGVPAQLKGMELEVNVPMKLDGGSTLDFGLQWEAVRGSNRNTGEALPRIAPMRTTFSVDWTAGPSLLRLEVQHASRQNRVPVDDAATPGWTQVHFMASHRWSFASAGDLLGYVKLGNITNELAFNAATLGSVRQRAPLPGRSLAAGMSWQF